MEFFVTAPATPTRSPRVFSKNVNEMSLSKTAGLKSANRHNQEDIAATPTAKKAKYGENVSNVQTQPKTPSSSTNSVATSSVHKNSSSPFTPSLGDRFIPSRKGVNMDACYEELVKPFNAVKENCNNGIESTSANSATADEVSKRVKYAATMGSILSPAPKRLFSTAANNVNDNNMSSVCVADSFEPQQQPGVLGKRRPLSSTDLFDNGYTYSSLSSSSSTSFAGGCGSATKRAKTSRILPNAPYRTLDAPDMLDDYYLNLLHWGKCNKLAVALRNSVYLWHPDTGNVDHLTTLADEDAIITSVQWSSQDTNVLAVGTSENTVQLWDASVLKQTNLLLGHSHRVSSLAWNENIISSGGRDSLIMHHDVRVTRRNSPISVYQGHLQEVCGLQWSPDGKTLASGGNENYLCLWDASMSGVGQSTSVNQRGFHGSFAPRLVIKEHLAAVKALAWCPFQSHTLATGGGTADKHIRLWNTATTTGSSTMAVDTGSQVCAIQWADHDKELVSSHGYSDNQLILWKYPSMSKVKEFRSHTSRVLQLAKSPDGNSLCSGSVDETLRFWNIFDSNGSSGSSQCGMMKGLKGKFISPAGMGCSSNLIR